MRAPPKDSVVLVVDDFSTMRRIIRNILRELGYVNVLEADDGTTALALLESTRVDLILTDWSMPIMEGIDLLKALRGDSKYDSVPIIMVTAENKRDQIIEAAKSGVNGYIIKPFNSHTLQDKIDKAYSRF